MRIPSGSFIKNKKPMIRRGRTNLNKGAFEIQIQKLLTISFKDLLPKLIYYRCRKSEGLNKTDSGRCFLIQEKKESWSVYSDNIPAGTNFRCHLKSPQTGSDIEGKGQYPVVHVLKDTTAYALWSKTRIPTETEWEYAESLGLIDSRIRCPGHTTEGKPVANTWQGIFPSLNTGKTAFLTLLQVVLSTQRNRLFDMMKCVGGQHSL